LLPFFAHRTVLPRDSRELLHNEVVDVTDRIALMGGGYSARPRRLMPVVAAAGSKPTSTNPVTTVEPPPIPEQATHTSDSAAVAGTESTDTGPGSFEELHRKCKGVPTV